MTKQSQKEISQVSETISEIMSQIKSQKFKTKQLWELNKWSRGSKLFERSKEVVRFPTHSKTANELNNLNHPDGTVRLFNSGKAELFGREEDLDVFDTGEVLVVATGGSFVLNYHNGKFLRSTDTLIFSPLNKDEISAKFLYYYLISLEDRLKELYQGSGIQHLKLYEFFKTPIPMIPIDLQNKIADLLETLDNSYKKLELSINKEVSLAKIAVNHYLKKTFEEITSLNLSYLDDAKELSLNEVQPQEPNKFREISFHPISELAKWSRVPKNFPDKSIIKYSKPQLPATELNNLNDPDGTIRLYKSGKDVLYAKEDVLLKRIEEIKAKNKKQKNLRIDEGEVLILGDGGSFNLNYHNGKFLTSDHTVTFYPINSNELSAKYLYYYLLSLEDAIQRLYRGAGLQNIQLSEFWDIEVPIIPIEEQHKIVTLLDAIYKYSIALSVHLENELELRRHQYNYYLKNLLKFDTEGFKDY